MAGAADAGSAGRRLRARHVLAMAAGIAVGAFLVSLAFVRVRLDGGFRVEPRFDPAAFAGRLPAHARWIPAFLLAAAALPALRSLVWRATLPPPPVRAAETYHATALGALVHNTIPGKLGPVAAAWILARVCRRPFPQTLSSQLVAKLLEMGAVVVLGAAAAAVLGVGGGVRHVVVAGAALFVAFASAAAAFAVAAPRAAARIGRRFPRAGGALVSLGEGIAGVGSPARLAAAAALAAAPALWAAAAYAIPLRTAGVGAAGGAVLVAVLTFGQLTPGLPIGTGVYWSLGAWASRELGAAPADAAAIAVLTHASMVAASLAVGTVSALVRRRAVVELVRRRREVERLASSRGPSPPAEASPRAPT